MAQKSRSAYGEKAKGFLSEEISHHVKEKGMPQDQAVAAAMSEARKKGLKVPKEGQTRGTKRAPRGRTRAASRSRTGTARRRTTARKRTKSRKPARKVARGRKRR